MGEGEKEEKNEKKKREKRGDKIGQKEGEKGSFGLELPSSYTPAASVPQNFASVLSISHLFF